MLPRRALALALVILAGTAHARETGVGSVRFEYQFIRTGTFYDDVAEYDYWTTDTHVALLSGDYTFADGWTVFASLPYVRKRFNPGAQFNGDPHNPNDYYWVDFVPPDKRFWDDGEYHGDLQDFSIGVSYLVSHGPFEFAPYLSYGVPASDYPFFAKAAIGANLWKVPVGVTFGYVPYFSDWFVNGNLTYVFSEQPIDINVDYWLVQLTAGYWFRPNFSMNAFASLKAVRDGLKLPWDFIDDPATAVYPDDFGTEEWWHHDRLLAHRNLDLGIGADYFFSPTLQLSGTWFTSVWTEQSNEVDYAFTVALTRYFGGE